MTSPVAAQSAGFNLLRIPLLRWLILWRGFPYLFQSAFLLVFLALAVLGWGQFAPPGVQAKLYAKCNLVTIAVWGLWWPAMVLVAVVLGRLWCCVCPLELVSNCSERLGKRLGIRQTALSKGLSAGSLVVVIFACVQLCVPGLQLHRVPAYTSAFLCGLLILAIWTGLKKKDRAFCRGFCPVALLLNAYGRGGMLAVRPRLGEGCPECDEHACARGSRREQWDGRGCPSLLNPAKLNSNRDCLVCGQCLKTCPSGKMELLLRAPFHRADHREEWASWPVTLFVLMVSGFVLYELCSEWKAAETVFLAVPQWLSQAWHAGALSGWIQGFWTVFVFPLLLWIGLGIIVRVSGGSWGILEAWWRLALPMAVLVSTGHIAKGVAKFNSWAGFWPLAWKEPDGIQTALSIHSKALAAPAPLLSMGVISVLCLIMVSAGLYFALREARLADPQYGRRQWPLFLVAGLFLFLIAGWSGFWH